jgi:hypothetical protein
MGIGHIALGFAAKRAVPRVSLATLIIASIFVDVLWSITLPLGLEHARIDPTLKSVPLDLYDYPITHSLLAGILWALVFGGAYFLIRKYRAGASMLGLLVLSHWVLDVISHRPDMPVLPSGPYLGLGLWNWPAAEIAVEEVMLAAGVWLYLRATSGPRLGLFVLVAILAVIGGLAYLGPPPPSLNTMAASNLIFVALVAVAAHFIDSRRTAALGAS